ncbi:uncharacterized protein LOC117644989 [Thrips palmi]|uniref:Uncharacterized protein LOC117644989 n=1 Tax=Thrips palmi TaxID=161013 RepID=A0A6P8Z2D2_THRPL|nr:uncharacterized protein LOC117644989 [Thrips palmi]
MLFRVLVLVAVAVVVTAPAEAFKSKKCSEVPGCLNEYQWKHKDTPARTKLYCAKRYPSCQNVDGRDLKEYCKVASAQCILFVYDYLGMTTKAKADATTYCKKRLPRC